MRKMMRESEVATKQAWLGDLTVSDYDYHDVPSRVWDEWERCNIEWCSYPFESVPWLRATADRLSQDISKRLLVVNKPHLGPIAFWPYALQHFRTGGVMPLVLCRPWVEDLRLAVSAVISPALDRETCRQIVHCFLDRLPRWHKMLIGLVREPSPLLEILGETLKYFGTRFEQETHTFAEVRGWTSFPHFLNSLSHDWRKKYNRLVKKDLEAGTIRLDHLDGLSARGALESIKSRILDIYRESWKVNSSDQYANLARPETFAWFSQLLEVFARQEGLHVIFTTVNGDDAAFYVGVRFGKIYCSLQTAYKQRYAPLSVGFLTQIENFRYTIEQGFLTNNLLGDQDYKTHLTEAVTRFSSFVVFNRNLRGAIAQWMSQTRVRLDHMTSREHSGVRKPPGVIPSKFKSAGQIG